ncbi:MAG: sulfatase-like hydrolase/transferase [Kiritimatiellae bacterium]|nr:sulfatase-like hydrolase/transferase [Kiritimatiellia bacterium]
MALTSRRAFLKQLGFGCAALTTSGSLPLTQTPVKPRNILFILADDLGWGDVSCYGTTPGLTPFLDEYATRGVQFTDAHAPASTCTPTRYAIFTGCYAWRKPGTGIAQGDAALLIDPTLETLPKLMQRSGMVTGAVGKWHLGMGEGPGKTDWNKPISPSANAIGFDYTFLMAATADRTPCVYVENGCVVNHDPADPIEVNYQHNYAGEPDGIRDRASLKMDWDFGHNQAVVNGIGRIGYMKGGEKARWKDEEMADIFVDKACAFMEKNRDKPFFLYLGTNDIHVPRVPHPRFVGSTPYGPRGDATRQFDDSVRRVIEKLRALGLERDTLVVISSDNGPVVNDGYKDEAEQKLDTHRPAAHWRGTKYTPFEGGHRVPFIVVWEGQIPKNQRSTALISLVDLGHTFAALRGVHPSTEALPDSFDVHQALLDPTAPSSRTAIISQDWHMSYREGDWKYVVPRRAGNAPNEKTKPQTGALFYLPGDPSETTNLIARYPEKARTLHHALLNAIRAGRTRP